MGISLITLKGLAELCRAGRSINLIDVSSPRDYLDVHIESARNVPLERLDAKTLLAEHQGTARDPLYIVGRSAIRSQEACEKLVSAGAELIVHVKGEATAWEAAGLPVIHGKKALPLDQRISIVAGRDPRVSIVAGALAIAGSALFFVNPAWMALTLLAGAILINAGITDN